jgi:hypothetical protein
MYSSALYGISLVYEISKLQVSSSAILPKAILRSFSTDGVVKILEILQHSNYLVLRFFQTLDSFPLFLQQGQSPFHHGVVPLRERLFVSFYSRNVSGVAGNRWIFRRNFVF